MDFSKMRIALVHYWYIKRRGGERVFDVLADMFPNADIFFIVADLKNLPSNIKSHRIVTSYIQKIPGATKHYRKMLPLFPTALEGLDLSSYDLVISQEAGPAKGVLTRSDTCHISYCHSPLRYVWEMYYDYLRKTPGGMLGNFFYALSAHYVRFWDYVSAQRVDSFVASSQNSRRRLNKYYGRSSSIVYPPCDLDRFVITSGPRSDFYLVVSPLVNYKRVDLAVKACNALKRPLIVIGTGEEISYLKSIAGPTIKLLGFQSDEQVRDYYSRCRAFIFPGEEDIGLTPIEAQASGAPVIAFGKGGALETVKGFYATEGYTDGSTGVFFRNQNEEDIIEAIQAFECAECRFELDQLRKQAEFFSTEKFKQEMYAAVEVCLKEFRVRMNL